MGRQIGFYFAAEDEEAMLDFICTKPLLCIPGTCPTADPEPQSPREVLTLDVKLIHSDYAELALRHLHTPNNRFWHLVDDGLYIDWQRTKANARMSDRYSGPAVYSDDGRFYFPTVSDDQRCESGVKESAAELGRIMTSIVRQVKHLSGKRTDDKSPYFIGQHLAQMAEKGEAKLFYRNGVSPLVLCDL